MSRRQFGGDPPEPVLRYFREVAKMQPPHNLLDAAVAEINNPPRQNRFSPVVMFALGAAATAAAIVALSLLVPGLRQVASPSTSPQPSSSLPSQPSPTASSDPSQFQSLQTRYLITLGSVVLGYNDFEDWPASHEARNKEIGFEPAWDDDTMGSYPANEPPPYVGPGLSYGWQGDKSSENAYGLVIGEITDVGYHQQANEAEWRASDADDFFRDLGTVPRPEGDTVYEVGRVQPTQLAGWPALAARVRFTGDAYAFLEDYDPPQHHAFVLDKVQQLIAADIGDSIVLVQVWAADEETLADWLPKAESFLATMQIEPAN